VVFRYYWNIINFNDIRCNFKALLNIFLHFGMDKMCQRGIFTKKKLIIIYIFFLLFPFFSEFSHKTVTYVRTSDVHSHLDLVIAYQQNS
jgi:hypothetical protein